MPPATVARAADDAVAAATSAGPAPAATRDEPNVGRSAAIGAAVGFALVTVAVTVGLALTLGEIGAAGIVGLGAFVGLWGGAGFGFMMGGTIPFALYLDAGHDRSTHGRHGGADDATPEPGPTARPDR